MSSITPLQKTVTKHLNDSALIQTIHMSVSDEDLRHRSPNLQNCFHTEVNETTVTYNIYICDLSYRPKELYDLVEEPDFNHLKAEICLSFCKLWKPRNTSKRLFQVLTITFLTFTFLALNSERVQDV